MIYFLQGAYVPEEEARVPVADRGFLFGDSIYETVRALGGRILFWDDHAGRLLRSAERLEIPISPAPYDLLDVIHQLLRKNEIDDARMRIIVSRGIGSRNQLEGFDPTWVVLVEPFTTLSDNEYESGVAAVIVTVARHSKASLDPEIKSSNLLNNLLARREARRQDAAEGIMLNSDRLLAEGAHSNLFWVTKQGILRTPSRTCGILPGVTRQKILMIADSLSIEVEEVEAHPEQLDEAEEIILTSTSWEVLAVTTYNGAKVGSGRRGRVASSLHRGLRDLYQIEGEWR